MKKEIHIKVKESFKTTRFWKRGRIFYNKKLLNDRKQVNSLTDLKIAKIYKYKLKTGGGARYDHF